MDKETYNMAVAINNRLNQLQKVKEELKDAHRHFLTYAREVELFGKCDGLCCNYIRGNIRAILDKHDKMIRQEIDGEIAALNKEIEEL